MNHSAVTTTHDPAASGEPTSRSRSGRRAGTVAALVAVAATLAAVSAPVASAEVNPNGAPIETYHLTGTDCRATVGAVRTTTGAAMGGVDISCGSRHRIAARAIEYRWNGSYWQHWSSGQFVGRTHYLTVHTGAICGGGYAQWVTKAYVRVDNRTYGPLASNDVTTGYAPPDC
jgi:hypothetical protein